MNAIWCTDPDYGLLSAYEGGGTEAGELPTALYRLDTGNRLHQVSTECINPTGPCFSPAGDILYIVESGSIFNAIWACELDAGRMVRHGWQSVVRRVSVLNAVMVFSSSSRRPN
ncbi:hypothetical protein GL297_14675 [Komagataeibacter sp. FXV2]|nr:hypothetical protein [Komagataeibacter sp. FXV2]